MLCSHKATQKKWLQNILESWPSQTHSLSPLENLWQENCFSLTAPMELDRLTELRQFTRNNEGENVLD